MSYVLQYITVRTCLLSFAYMFHSTRLKIVLFFSLHDMTFCPQNEELEQAFSVYHSNKEVLLKEVEERGQRLEREQQEKEDIKKVRWGACERKGNVLCIFMYIHTYVR